MRFGMAMVLALASIAPVASAQPAADFAFEYRYPPKAAGIAPLRAWLDADRASLRARVIRDAGDARREARKNGFPFRPYDVSKAWQVVTDTPRFLSLSMSSYRYSGGAHGNTNSGGLLWDKRTGRRIAPKAVFASDATLQAAVRPAWCAWLKAERKRRVGIDAGSDALFGQCPPLRDLTVLLGSSTGRAIDRIGLIADQYVAGSYAEGQYETTVPVTAAVLRAVKPAYRDAFAVR